jgi:hypothetical protein
VTSSANAPTAQITDDRDELVAFFDYAPSTGRSLSLNPPMIGWLSAVR